MIGVDLENIETNTFYGCFTIGKFVFIPSMDLEKLIAMRRPAAKSVFMPFCAKADFLHMAWGFLFEEVSMCKLNSKPTIITFEKCLGTIGIRRNKFEDLVC